MQQKSITLLIALISTILNSMNIENSNGTPLSVLTIVAAGCDNNARNRLRQTCHELKKTIRVSNLQLYRNKHLVLSNRQKNYALSLACYHKDLKAQKNLKKLGANPRILNSLYFSAIDLEEYYNNDSSSASIDEFFYDNINNPLPQRHILAAYFDDHAYIGQHINDVSIDWLYQDPETDNNALEIAAYQGHIKTVKKLLKSPYLRATITYTLCEKIAPIYPLIVELLIGHHPNINAPIPNSPHCYLSQAVLNNNFDIVKMLCSHPTAGVKIDGITPAATTPLYLACQKGNVSIVRYLLSQKASTQYLYKNSFTPLYAAAKRGHVNVARLLLLHNLELLDKPSRNGITPVYVASQYGRRKMVKLLCAYGADINTASLVNEYTPLHTASINRYPKVIAILLSYYPQDVNKLSKDGTALHCASRSGHCPTVAALLKCPDINIFLTHKTNTAVHLATKHNHASVVTYLLYKAPFLINLCNKEGNSPLHISVQNDNIALTTLLLQVPNILINLINKKGQTPLDIAYKNNNKKMIELLRPYGSVQYHGEFADY